MKLHHIQYHRFRIPSYTITYPMKGLYIWNLHAYGISLTSWVSYSVGKHWRGIYCHHNVAWDLSVFHISDPTLESTSSRLQAILNINWPICKIDWLFIKEWQLPWILRPIWANHQMSLLCLKYIQSQSHLHYKRPKMNIWYLAKEIGNSNNMNINIKNNLLPFNNDLPKCLSTTIGVVSKPTQNLTGSSSSSSTLSRTKCHHCLATRKTFSSSLKTTHPSRVYPPWN